MKKAPKIIWTNVILFTAIAALSFIAVPWYGIVYGYDSFHWIATVLAIGYCGMSITAGYHRLWSHRAYQTHAVIRIIYAIGGAFAVQNSALHWASDHRVHHRYVDQNDRDPYSAKRGFWYSHIGWMLREYQSHRYDDYSNVKDLQRDPVVMWQHKHYLLLTLVVNFGIPLLLGVLYGDVWGMLLTVGVLRLFVSHHVTFFINSLAHIWGRQPYSDENTAKDNGLIAFFTFGEGYHNYHHHFQFDYRNGIRWWQFDPTKWLINTLSWLKLATNLRQCDETRIEQARAEMLMKKTQQKLAEKPEAEELLHKLKLEYDNYCTRLAEFYVVKKEWLESKRTQISESCEQEIVLRYQELKQKLSQQKARWIELNLDLKRNYAF